MHIVFPDATALEDQYALWYRIFSQASAMGQSIGDPPDVAGWPAYYSAPAYHELWINATTLPARNAFTGVLVGLGVAGWLVIRSGEQTELSRMAEMLETRSGLAAMTLRPLFDQSGQAVPGLLLHATVRELSHQARLRITVIKQDGTVLSDSAVPAGGLTHVDNHLARPEVAQALASGRGMDIRARQTTGERTYYVARLLSEQAPLQPGVPVIRLGLPLTSIDERVRHIQQDLVTAFGAAFPRHGPQSLGLAQSHEASV